MKLANICRILPLFVITSCSNNIEHLTSDNNLPIIPSAHENPKSNTSRISYLIHTGKIHEAIQALTQERKTNAYLFHTPILEDLGLTLLQNAIQSRNNEDVLLALYGAGISLNEQVIPIVREALFSDDPTIQLTAINVLSTFDTDEANVAIIDAMMSDFVIVRIEAAYHLAMKKHKNAFDQIYALGVKLPPQARPVLPHLYALEGSSHSIQELKRLIYDSDQEVRLETILAISESGRDDLLDEVRKINDPSPSQQEAQAWVFAVFADEKAKPLLQHIAKLSGTQALVAHWALYRLGDTSSLEYIEEEAIHGDPFAIRLLGHADQDSDVLLQCVRSRKLQTSVNATLALIDRKNEQAFVGIPTIFIDNPKDLSFQPVYSLGKALSCWRVTPSSSQNLPSDSFFMELSLRLREEALTKTLDFNEDAFLDIAQLIFDHDQRDLIPLLVRLLENLRSEKAIQLLTKEQQRPGNPFIRAWCNLALYRLKEPGPWADNVREWVKKSDQYPLFQTRPVLPWRMRNENQEHGIALEDQSRLLVESFQALAESQDEEGLFALLSAIEKGNPHNTYTLCGLLIRAAQ